MHYFRPRKALKNFAKAAWQFLAHELRLSSYFFGQRVPNEEYTYKNWTVPFRSKPSAESRNERIKDGTFRRVPATDHLALPRDMRATAAVTESGEPVDDVAKDLISRQDAEALKAKRDISKDYMIVYIPPHFSYRILAFMSGMWILGAVILGVIVALPIQIGRSFFSLFLSYDVHDGYSFIVGFYLLWVCFIVGKAVDRLDKRRQRRGVEGPRADLRILVMKRGLLWLAKTSYMVFFLGIIIPTLISFVVDLYVILPIRFFLDPTLVPRIRVIDSWVLGLLYVKIGLHAHQVQPQSPIFRGIDHVCYVLRLFLSFS